MPQRGLVVIAADDGDRVQRANAIDDFVRRRAVADEIAEDEQVIPGAGAASSTAVERLDVRVNVGNDQIAHRGVDLRLADGPTISLGDFVGRGAADVDPQVRLRVRDPPGGEQPLHLAAIGGERPPAVGRQPRQHDVDRHVEPDRQAVQIDGGAVVGVDEGAAARGDDDVPQRQQDLEDLAFHGAEVRLAGAREDIGDGPPLARLDQLVDVLGAPAEPRRQARATVVLPAAMNPTR